mgnify:CR=1 FL=1
MRQLASLHDIDVSPENPWIQQFKWISYLVYDEMDQDLRDFFHDFWRTINKMTAAHLCIITCDIHPLRAEQKTETQIEREFAFRETMNEKLGCTYETLPYLVFCESIDSDEYYIFKFNDPDNKKMLRSAIRYICVACEKSNNFDELQQHLIASKYRELVRVHAPGFISRNLISLLKVATSSI